MISKVENQNALNQISEEVFKISCEFLNVKPHLKPHEFFNQIHDYLKLDKLNGLRLHIINHLQKCSWFKEAYFSLAESLIKNIVGSELAMQKNMGLSIQLPNDDSSLLAPHSDIWGSECSAFEAVLWLPLVDCFNTKSVFILPPEKDRHWRKKTSEIFSMDTLFEKIKKDVQWLNINYGEVLLFSPTILHGNRVNQENETRWSFNIRFKGLFTPYSGKGLGDYFFPLRISPLSKIAMEFDFPKASQDE